MRRAIRFLRAGSVVELADFAPDATLLDHLRLVDRRTGGKEGCGRGACGSCTVALGATSPAVPPGGRPPRNAVAAANAVPARARSPPAATAPCRTGRSIPP